MILDRVMENLLMTWNQVNETRHRKIADLDYVLKDDKKGDHIMGGRISIACNGVEWRKGWI